MRVLIANPFGIGDVLFSLPLVRAVRAAAPGAFIGYFCNRRTEELVASWPEIDWHHPFEKDEFRRRWKNSKRDGFRFLSGTLGALRQRRFDLLLDLSMGWHAGFAGLLCGIPKRAGFDFRGRGRFLTDAVPLKEFSHPVADHYLDLLQPVGIPRPDRISWDLALSEEADRSARYYLQRNKLEGEALAALVPGGGASWGPNARFKQWPPERFAKVADHLARQHRLEILLLGDASEEPLCREVAARMSSPPRLIVQVPSLLLLASLLKRCRIVVGNDGGLLHLAEGAGAPTVSIFGPVNASVYGPVPDSPPHRVVAKTLACRPCYREFRFPPCPWDNACLKELDVGPVLKAAEELLA